MSVHRLMSVSSRGTKNFQHDEEVSHVVCLEETPSPPPKPPRGIYRKGAPMKPQRSAIRIEPLQNDEKENAQPSQFKARDTMSDMMSYFERSIAILRRSEEFTGTEAADVLSAYIEGNRSKFTAENIGRHNVIKLLEMWRTQNFIRCVDPNQKMFIDSERAFYRLAVEAEQNLYVAASPAPSRAFEDPSTSRTSSTRRNNSFKRLFSPLVRRNRSNSRGREKENMKDSTTGRSTWSLFSSSSSKQDKKARRAEQQLIKEEEAEVYELALFHLLRLIEVEFLEDVALPVQDAKKNASFLSSILEKVGFGSGEDHLDADEEDEMDLLIETHPLLRDSRNWFQMARCFAPTLYLEKSADQGKKVKMHLWCKQALDAVSARLSKITMNGESPLFPNEFSPLLAKIAEQLIQDVKSEEKLDTAVMYLYLMVPTPLRSTIDQVVQWLQITLRPDAAEDLRGPWYLGKQDLRHKENYKVIRDEIRQFIFPKSCMTNQQKDLIIETLVNLRSNNLLGSRPEELENSIRAKCVFRRTIERRRRERKHSGAGEDLTPVRFTIPRESLREKAVQKNKEGLTTTELALVQMIEVMLDNKNISLTDKKKQLFNFQKIHPELYKRFFKDMI